MAGEAVSDAEPNRDGQPSKHALAGYTVVPGQHSVLASLPTIKCLAKRWGLANIGSLATLLSNTVASYFNTAHGGNKQPERR